MWTKEQLMRLPPEKLPVMGSDKTYNDVVSIEQDFKNNEEKSDTVILIDGPWPEIGDDRKSTTPDFLKDMAEKFKQEQ